MLDGFYSDNFVKVETNPNLIYELVRNLNPNQLSSFLSFLQSHSGGGVSFDGKTVAAVACFDTMFPIEAKNAKNDEVKMIF